MNDMAVKGASDQDSQEAKDKVGTIKNYRFGITTLSDVDTVIAAAESLGYYYNEYAINFLRSFGMQSGTPLSTQKTETPTE
jgi:hypothetical protein